MRRNLTFLAATALSAAAVVGAIPAAHAAEDPFLHAQVGLTYTVYEPQKALGLKMGAAHQTGFQLQDCAGSDEQVDAVYGGRLNAQHEVVGRSFTLLESLKGCEDGPDGVGPAGTFTALGATATVMGSCAGGKSTCSSATKQGVRKQAYTTVTLPAASGLKPTFVELYTTGLSFAQIRTIVGSLKAVQ